MVLQIVDSRKRHIDIRGQLQVVLKDGSTGGSGTHAGRHEVAGDGWEKYAQLVPQEHGRPHWRNQKPISMHKSVRLLKAHTIRFTLSLEAFFKKPSWLTTMQTFPFGWAFYHDSSDNINKLQNCPICTDTTLGGYGEATLLSWLTFIGLWSLLLGFILIAFFFENRNSKRGGMATHAGVALELGIKRPSSSSGGIKMMSPQMEAILIWCQCRTRNYVNRII